MRQLLSGRNWPQLTPKLVFHVIRFLYLRSLSFNTDSKDIDELELLFRHYTKKPFTLALNSGTSGLHLAFLCMGLKKGDLVLATDYTFPATLTPLVGLGVRVVLVDIEPGSPSVDLNRLKELVKELRPKVVVVSHMDGYPSDIEDLAAIRHEYGFQIIEDCCQSFGGKYGGRNVGELGDIAIFSFQQKKLLAGGEGGLLACNSRHVFEKAVLLSHLQARSFRDVEDQELRQFASTGLGYNFRIHPFSAVLVKEQFNRYLDLLKRRRKMAVLLTRLLCRSEIFETLHADPSRIESSYYSYKFLVAERWANRIDEITEAFQRAGLGMHRSVATPIHEEPLFRSGISASIHSSTFSLDSKFQDNVGSFISRSVRLNANEYHSPLDYVRVASRVRSAIKKLKESSNATK